MGIVETLWMAPCDRELAIEALRVFSRSLRSHPPCDRVENCNALVMFADYAFPSPSSVPGERAGMED
ncbi:MAG: hypothetical protein PHQ81_10695, partial [Methanofollis sp.]|nr:hypothetical protein [Methanofollis sp.]